MMLSIKSNIESFSRDLDDIAKKQLPYATALAINDVAERVIVDEMAEIIKDFPTATPFTRNRSAWGKIPATKYNPFCTIFMKDIQERYLEPYTDGGQSVPTAGGGMVVPVKIPVNQYGNIPYKKIASLKANPAIFYANKSDQRFHGAKSYSGIFQRVSRGTGPRGGKLTTLVTLAKIEDPWNVKQQFDFEGRATATVEANIEDALEQAMLKALGSMR